MGKSQLEIVRSVWQSTNDCEACVLFLFDECARFVVDGVGDIVGKFEKNGFKARFLLQEFGREKAQGLVVHERS